MPITVPQTETILKSYFQTGDVPTQDQFAEFIGTMFYLYTEILDASTEATTAVTAIQEHVLTYCRADFTNPAAIALVGQNYNISGVTYEVVADGGPGGAYNGYNSVVFHFTANLPDVDYSVLFRPFKQAIDNNPNEAANDSPLLWGAIMDPHVDRLRIILPLGSSIAAGNYSDGVHAATPLKAALVILP